MTRLSSAKVGRCASSRLTSVSDRLMSSMLAFFSSDAIAVSTAVRLVSDCIACSTCAAFAIGAIACWSSRRRLSSSVAMRTS